jgi:hypothetical protein
MEQRVREAAAAAKLRDAGRHKEEEERRERARRDAAADSGGGTSSSSDEGSDDDRRPSTKQQQEPQPGGGGTGRGDVLYEFKQKAGAGRWVVQGVCRGVFMPGGMKQPWVECLLLVLTCTVLTLVDFHGFVNAKLPLCSHDTYT